MLFASLFLTSSYIVMILMMIYELCAGGRCLAVARDQEREEEKKIWRRRLCRSERISIFMIMIVRYVFSSPSCISHYPPQPFQICLLLSLSLGMLRRKIYRNLMGFLHILRCHIFYHFFTTLYRTYDGFALRVSCWNHDRCVNMSSPDTPRTSRYIHVDIHLLSIDCRENCERRHSGIQMTLLFIGNNFSCFISYLFTQFDVLCARSFYLCVILLQNVLEFSGFRFVHLAGFNSCDWLPFFASIVQFKLFWSIF